MWKDIRDRLPGPRFLIFISILSTLASLSSGLYQDFRPKPDLEKLNMAKVKFSKLVKDSVWVKRTRRRGKWEKVWEVHFQDRPIYLAYSSFDSDVYYSVFRRNCWKLLRDSSITLWYAGAPHPSDKYPWRNVIRGGQVEKLITRAESIYTPEDLLAARRDGVAGWYQLAGTMGLISLALFPFAFPRKRPKETSY